MRTKQFNYEQILSVLQKHEVKFVVIGGVCAMMHGAPVVTFDLDIVPERQADNLERLEAALTELHTYYREHPPMRIVPNAQRLNTKGHYLLMTDAGPMDVLGTVIGGRGYEELLPETVIITLDADATFTMLTLPMLILLKQETNRAKDRQHLPILRRVLSELQNTDEKS